LVEIKYVRGDLYDLPPQFTSNDSSNGNPPWGSCPGLTLGCSTAPDNDADGKVDPGSVQNRRNQGMYSAVYDKERPRPGGQFPSDALAGPSCPLGIVGCDPYVQDCGGLAHFNTFKGFPGTAPNALGPPDTANPAVYPNNAPASPQDWPIVPFRREWLGTDYPGGNSPESAIKRLLRFSSSIVSYRSSAPADTPTGSRRTPRVPTAAYPLAGALSTPTTISRVFCPDRQWRSDQPSTAALHRRPDHRRYDERDRSLRRRNRARTGRRPGAAAAWSASARMAAVPIRARIGHSGVRGSNSNPAFFPALNCIADNSGGQLFAATDKTQLLGVLESLLDFKRNANYFASPSLPAFAGGFGDTAQIGAVVPSHLNPNGDLSSWSIWSGTIKSHQLDSNGQI
jgi:hypothetical protein